VDAHIRSRRRPRAVPRLYQFTNVARSAVVFVAIAVAGCATPAAPPATVSIPPGATGSTIPATTATPAPASPSAAAAASFPLALTDDEGTSVSIATAPTRIVSLTPATTEILFALGVGDRLVGKVDDPALYPPAADKVPNVAKFGSVDIEKIVALRADLVIAGGNTFTPPEAVAKLRSLHVPTVVVYAPTVDKVFGDVELTGLAVGRPSEAAALAASLRGEFAQVSAATASLPKPRVFYEIDASGAIYGPADKSFLAEMIELAGGQPVTTGSATKFDIPIERLIAANPEVILLGDAAYGVTVAQVTGRPGWSVMAAVKSKTIRPIDDVIVTRPGPRIGRGLRALVAAIHPDLVLPSAAP
jgi:iron complex transport system substrate-binding protein